MQYTETEEKIFSSALEAFAVHGKDGARMQDIANKAGINKALVHYYFRSKERLYEAVVTYVVERYIRNLSDSLQSETNFKQFLRSFITNYIDVLALNPLLPKFLIREIAAGAPIFKKKMEAMIRSSKGSMIQTYYKHFQEGIDQGEVRPLDPSQTFITIIGSCIFFFLAHPMFALLNPHIEKRFAKFTDERKSHLFDILYYGLQPRPELQK